MQRNAEESLDCVESIALSQRFLRAFEERVSINPNTCEKVVDYRSLSVSLYFPTRSVAMKKLCRLNENEMRGDVTIPESNLIMLRNNDSLVWAIIFPSKFNCFFYFGCLIRIRLDQIFNTILR